MRVSTTITVTREGLTHISATGLRDEHGEYQTEAEVSGEVTPCADGECWVVVDQRDELSREERKRAADALAEEWAEEMRWRCML